MATSRHIDGEREREVLSHWTSLANEVQQLCLSMRRRTAGWEGLNSDPAAFSLALFKRAHGHIRAFSLLYNNKFFLDADGSARSAVEVAICLANLERRREAFVQDLRSDAAHTAKGQIPIWFEAGGIEAREAVEEVVRIFGDRREDGSKHEKLSPSTLAKGAGIPDLYSWYRHFSGTRVHVTGLSMLMDFVGVDDLDHEAMVETYARMRKIDALATVCGSTVISCRAHATIHKADDEHEAALDLMRRMSVLGPAEIFGPIESTPAS